MEADDRTLLELLTDAMQSSEDAKTVTAAYERLSLPGATYRDAYRLSDLLTARAWKALQKVDLTKFPDPYIDILKFLQTSIHDRVAAAAAGVQTKLNSRMQIGIKGIAPDADKGKLSGLAHNIAHPDDNTMDPRVAIQTFGRGVVDDTVRVNAEFNHRSGVEVTVTRISHGACCKWCNALTGAYKYPGVPGEIFQRHDNCTCEVVYNGRRLRAYTSKAGKANTFRDY